MHKYLTVAVVALLSACATVGEVTPIGDGKYTVGSHVMGGMTSWTEVKAMAIRRGSEYCGTQDKEVSDVDVKTHGARGWTPLEAEVTFKCKAAQEAQK